MQARKIILSCFAPAAAAILVQGCSSSHLSVVLHDPPLERNVHRVVKGTTTRTEILNWFGVPDILADGNLITLYPESAMGQYRARMRAELEKNKADMEKAGLNIDPEFMDKVAKLQPYSSIDDEHVALLYVEMKVESTPTGRLSGETVCYTNKVLFFINKNTGIVDEFSSHFEFRAD
jgi:hypothetical protein